MLFIKFKSKANLKVIFVIVFTISLVLLALILSNRLFFGPEGQTMDTMFAAFGRAFLVFIFAVTVSIILILKLKEKILGILFNYFFILLIVEIIFLVIANLNNWWK